MPRRSSTGEVISLDASRPHYIGPILEDAEIACRAYEIFQDRGGQHGRDLDDWLQAERELLGITEKAS